MEAKLRQCFERLLKENDSGFRSVRLIEDAERLVDSIQELAKLTGVSSSIDFFLMELAAYALQLPRRQAGSLPVGKLGQINRRRLADQAIEQVISGMGSDLEEETLEKLVNLLGNFHEKSPLTVEGRLLSDALNLDDFGWMGLLGFVCRAALQGLGIKTVLEGAQKREQYGYWEFRLREDFHFPAIRDLAAERWIELREWLKRPGIHT